MLALLTRFNLVDHRDQCESDKDIKAREERWRKQENVTSIRKNKQQRKTKEGRTCNDKITKEIYYFVVANN